MRSRNLVQPEEMPYEAPTGAVHDGGDYPRLLEEVQARMDLVGFRARQAKARASGRLLGLGVALGLEASPSNVSLQRLIDPAHTPCGESEAALVRIGVDGRVTVALGTVPQGQGHETTVAQIAADALGMDPGMIDVLSGYDSSRDPSTANSGTHASRFAVMGSGAVLGACRAMRELLDERARIGATAGPESRKDLEARFVFEAPLGPAHDDMRGNFSLTYAYGATIVEVAIDQATGRVSVERIASVHDCGVQLNPMIVEGQVHGAIAHQLGAALFERMEYDDQGQLITSTFKNYLTPTAVELPSFECGHFVTPSLFAPLGARGGGEGSGTPLVAAINAVADALAHRGVVLTEGHASPADVWTLLRAHPATPSDS
jgi:2-furoyl-CoA dehydrogenase large subunit